MSWWKTLFILAGVLWSIDLVRIIADSNFTPTRFSIGVAYFLVAIYMFIEAARE